MSRKLLLKMAMRRPTMSSRRSNFGLQGARALGCSMTSSQAQHWNPEQYGKNARFVSDLGMPVVDLLSPQSGERILDLGCGDGALSLKLVELGCKVVGVDSSAEMIRAAHSLGLDAHVVDGQSLPYDNEFDAVFSNAALHWMKEPEKVIAGVWRALRPGGRFVGEFGGYGNAATIFTAALRNPRSRAQISERLSGPSVERSDGPMRTVPVPGP